MRLTILLLSLWITYGFGQNVQLSGFVQNSDNESFLAGASIFVIETGNGTTTDTNGFYALELPLGSYSIEYSYLGFQKDTAFIKLTTSTKHNIRLNSLTALLEGVVVRSSGSDGGAGKVEISQNRLSLETIKKLPSLLGEVEVLRTIQLLPGVNSVGEGATGFNVRGGSIGQNLALLDAAPIYNVSHLLGFFSIFNPDAIKDVKLYKGGIPASLGGRLSSVLDVTLKEGKREKFAMNGGIGLIFSRLSAEGPIIKNKASFIVSGRRSYLDILARPFLNGDANGSIFNFYDLTLKTNFEFGKKDRLSLSGYLGRDNFGFGDQAGFDWGNKSTSLIWNHLFNSQLSASLTGYYSLHDYNLGIGIDDVENSFGWQSSILNYSLQSELSYYPHPNFQIRLGGQGMIYRINPGEAEALSEGELVDLSLTPKNARESALYLESEIHFLSKMNANFGLRYSHFNYIGYGKTYEFEEFFILDISSPPKSVQEFQNGESIQTYHNYEPRLALEYQINSFSSFKSSYVRSAQYVHLISNTTASIPLDVWTVSSNNIQPQIADHYSIGYFRSSKNNIFESSLEVYYKDLRNTLEYTSDADLILNEFVEGSILVGQGRAYGMEWFGQKNEGRLQGWISYTLAKTERLVEGINNNNWFPTRFDQTHNFSIVSSFELSERWSLGANFVYQTGSPTTFPNARFEQQGYIVPYEVFESRNNQRLPAYHRLDLSITLKNKFDPSKSWKDKWVFSIYNIYHRRNAFDIYFRQNRMRTLPSTPVSTEAVRLSVIGSIVPAVAYNFEF